MRGRTFRAIVFLVAGWPLLMPQGMCICQFVQAGEGIARSENCQCSEDEEGCCPYGGDEEYAWGNKGVPSDQQCPPGCPANKKEDHSKLAGRHVPITASVLAASPLPFFPDLSSALRCRLPLAPPQPPQHPIYIKFGALLI
jgi:hypothetical protein